MEMFADPSMLSLAANRSGDSPAAATDPNSSGAPLLLTMVEVCDLLRLSRAHVNRLVAAGRLPSVKIGRSRRFRYADVVAFVHGLSSSRADDPGESSLAGWPR